jgi:hypothetical protein
MNKRPLFNKASGLRREANKNWPFWLYAVALVAPALTWMSCSPKATAYENRNFTVACDSISLNDSSWYQPVIFRFTPHYIHHTNSQFEEFSFRILEKGHRELFVRSEDNRLYLVSFDLTQSGSISFKRLGRITHFKILNVIDNTSPAPSDSVLLTSGR